jgi:hypothetical protein
MGSGRDKKKKAKEKKEGPVVGKGADKTERKTAKNEQKKERRADKRLAGALPHGTADAPRGAPGSCSSLNSRHPAAASLHAQAHTVPL